MQDVLDELLTVWRAGGTAGVATVVRTIKSAPRPPGATMVVSPDGTVAGSVSGGCVEAAVYELANEVVASGRPELQRYGISDDDAFAVGLTCGGIIDIFAEPVSRNTFPQLQGIADDIAAHRPTAIATVIAHPDPDWLGRRLVIGPHAVEGSLGSGRADAAVADDARGLLAAGRTTVLTYGPDGQRQETGMEVFVASHAPRPRMLIFGAIDFASALARQGAFLGAWVKPDQLTQPKRVAAVSTLEDALGRRLNIVNTYRRMDQDLITDSDLTFTERGSTMMISWAGADTRAVTVFSTRARLRNR